MDWYLFCVLHYGFSPRHRLQISDHYERYALALHSQTCRYHDAQLQPNLLVSVEECEDGWCRVEAREYSGWLKQSTIWGVYEAENFN